MKKIKRDKLEELRIMAKDILANWETGWHKSQNEDYDWDRMTLREPSVLSSKEEQDAVKERYRYFLENLSKNYSENVFSSTPFPAPLTIRTTVVGLFFKTIGKERFDWEDNEIDFSFDQNYTVESDLALRLVKFIRFAGGWDKTAATVVLELPIKKSKDSELLCLLDFKA